MLYSWNETKFKNRKVFFRTKICSFLQSAKSNACAMIFRSILFCLSIFFVYSFKWQWMFNEHCSSPQANTWQLTLFNPIFFPTKVLPHNLFSIHNKFICFLHYQTIVQPINERIFFSSKSCTSLEAFFFFSGKQMHIQSQS